MRRKRREERRGRRWGSCDEAGIRLLDGVVV